MSIQHDTEKESGVPPRASPAVQDERTPFVQGFPPPPRPPMFSFQGFPPPPRPPRQQRSGFWILISALALMLVLLAGLGIFFIPALLQRPGGQATATPTAPVQVTPTTATTPTTPVTTPTAPVVTPTPTPGVVLGPQACPAPASNSAYWNAIIGTIAGKRQVEGISCANILGQPSLQAVVQVRYIASGVLDVYGFDHISAHPTRIFLLQGLANGDARISGYNTIMTAETDRNPATPDLFREFQWSASKGGLVQVAFPGIFPDLTRYQAEADQAWVTTGRDSWKKDAKQVALRFVNAFLNWQVPATAIIVSGGGASDVNATVRVRAEIPGTSVAKRPYLTVMLSRLEGNTHNMWVAIALNQGSTLLTTIQPRSLIASPVKLEGTGSPYEGDIGEAYILDHAYARVGHAHLTVPPGWGMRNGPYSVQVGYELSFTRGPQEGVVEVEQTNPSGLGSFAAVMVKVLLNPQPRVVQGPVFCPVAALAGLGIDTIGGLTPRCANLKGTPSLQALLPANGKFVVYDQITSAHPVQIWSIQTQSAQISGVNTIMTDDVVNGSHVYREFRWSSKAGTFVQIVFPGMYPDLTRWQAEEGQRQVIVGEAPRISALATVIGRPGDKAHPGLMATVTGLKGWTGKLVKGGGSRDLTAVVEATYQGGNVTRVTLSRLEGTLSGIWEVTAVQRSGISISTPGVGSTITSPVMVAGSGPQFESQVGTIYILDRLYTRIGRAFAMGNAGFGSGPFTASVSYSSNLQGGAQEGIIELIHETGKSSADGVVLVKVLISA